MPTLAFLPDGSGTPIVGAPDDLSAAGHDRAPLDTCGIPKPGNWAHDTGQPWDQICANHLVLVEKANKLKDEFLARDFAELDGLPMSVSVTTQ